MGAKNFTTLYWNVWVESQLEPIGLMLLKERFDDIIAEYRPEVFGLNEVTADTNGRSPLLEHLERRGYHTFFVPFSPERDGQVSGSALVSRMEPTAITPHELGPDEYGAIRGFPGNTIKLIHARLPVGSQHVNVLVNYMAHLVPWNWPAHLKHHRAFRKITKAPEFKECTIIGGDFNQLKFMPHLWGAKSLYNRATGTFFRPTWKLLGGKIPIIQANYDNIFWTKCGRINLQNFQILERSPSDHAPLLTRFEVR